MKNLFSLLLDLLAPRPCIECGVPIEGAASPLCKDCFTGLPWWRRIDGCPRCGSLPVRPDPFAPFGDTRAGAACPGCFALGSALHDCRALLRYAGPVRRWIPGFKTAHGPFGPPVEIRVAIDFLGRALAEQAARESEALPDCVLGVPLHPRRLRWRGFNQIDPIARQLAARVARPWLGDGLERIRETPPQATRIGRERVLNLRGAFRATSSLPRNARVWLVDDVLTTGSTLEAAAEALLEAGALEVRGLTLAATLPARRARPGYGKYHLAPSNGGRHRPKPR